MVHLSSTHRLEWRCPYKEFYFHGHISHFGAEISPLTHRVLVTGGGPTESTINDMQTYMDMLNPDVGGGVPNSKDPATNAATQQPPPPPPPFPPPPPPDCPSQLPPPPGYPPPQPPEDSDAEIYLKVKSNLRHVENEVSFLSFFTGEKQTVMTLVPQGPQSCCFFVNESLE